MAYAQRLPPTRMMTLLMSVQEASSFVNRSTPPATATKTCPTNLNVTALAADAVEQLFYSVHESLLSVDRNVPTPCPVMERAPRRGGHCYRFPAWLPHPVLDLCRQVSGCRRCQSTGKCPLRSLRLQQNSPVELIASDQYFHMPNHYWPSSERQHRQISTQLSPSPGYR